MISLFEKYHLKQLSNWNPFEHPDQDFKSTPFLSKITPCDSIASLEGLHRKFKVQSIYKLLGVLFHNSALSDYKNNTVTLNFSIEIKYNGLGSLPQIIAKRELKLKHFREIFSSCKKLKEIPPADLV